MITGLRVLSLNTHKHPEAQERQTHAKTTARVTSSCRSMGSFFPNSFTVQSVITSVIRNEQKHVCNKTLETGALGRWRRTPSDREGPGENRCSQLEDPGWSRAAAGSIGPQGPAQGCSATRPTEQ